MLNYQKNKLINLILQFEIAHTEIMAAQKPDESMRANLTLSIERNIQSVKKLINKL